MAGNAGRWRRGNVHPRQGKTNRRMIKNCSCPSRGRMAGVASLREPRLHVIGARRGLIVGQVAGHTCRHCNAVVAVDVAARAWNRCGVKTSQRETGCIMIKGSRRPGCDRMARCTLRRRNWKSGRDVVRHVPANRCGALVSRLVAPITIRRSKGEVVVYMASGAGRRRVRSDQGKPRGAVVKTCRRPTYRRMATRAVRCRKLRTRRGMYRVGRLLPGRQMAARIPAAVQSGCQVVIVIDVAGSAGRVGMPIGKWEPG